MENETDGSHDGMRARDVSYRGVMSSTKARDGLKVPTCDPTISFGDSVCTCRRISLTVLASFLRYKHRNYTLEASRACVLMECVAIRWQEAEDRVLAFPGFCGDTKRRQRHCAQPGYARTRVRYVHSLILRPPSFEPREGNALVKEAVDSDIDHVISHYNLHNAGCHLRNVGWHRTLLDSDWLR